jgi:hypothetical protein
MKRILTNDEIDLVTEATIKGSSGLADPDQIFAALKWAERARVEERLLAGVLNGRFLVDARHPEPKFSLAEPLVGDR